MTIEKVDMTAPRPASEVLALMVAVIVLVLFVM
jgi:hypothetical protein